MPPGILLSPLKTESPSDAQSLFAGRFKALCKQELEKEKETSLPRPAAGQALGSGLCMWFLHSTTILQKVQGLSPLRSVYSCGLDVQRLVSSVGECVSGDHTFKRLGPVGGS